MEFGRLPTEQLSEVKFTLPEDPAENDKILGAAKNAKRIVYVGCPMWGREEWVGKIYPFKAKERDFLYYYAQLYNCIELNATHYRIFNRDSIIGWLDKVKDNRQFRFCPKMYKGITHSGSLLDKESSVEIFLSMAKEFDKNLGPILIQLSDYFAPTRKKELFAFLSKLPNTFTFFLELRHPDWFTNKEKSSELFEFLQTHHIGLVITDTAGKREILHSRLTIPKCFIRLVINGNHESDLVRINQWVEKLNGWIKKGIDEVYLFLHVNEEQLTPDLTKYLVEQLNEKCKLQLPEVKFI